MGCTSSMRDVAASIRDVAIAMGAVAVANRAVHDLFGKLQPLCGLL